MIVALLNQKGGVRKTTLALHLAGLWAREGKQVVLIDADPRGNHATTAEFIARLTIDVTPALGGRIKIAAFQRSLTVADMLSALLDREFPDKGGAAS